jgi:hypothetical protein
MRLKRVTLTHPAYKTWSIIMSLVAIKGIYQNGHITLEENIATKKSIAVIVTFLEEQPSESTTSAWEQWFASMSQFSDDFMANGREQPLLQERDWSAFE